MRESLYSSLKPSLQSWPFWKILIWHHISSTTAMNCLEEELAKIKLKRIKETVFVCIVSKGNVPTESHAWAVVSSGALFQEVKEPVIDENRPLVIAWSVFQFETSLLPGYGKMLQAGNTGFMLPQTVPCHNAFTPIIHCILSQIMNFYLQVISVRYLGPVINKKANTPVPLGSLQLEH